MGHSRSTRAVTRSIQYWAGRVTLLLAIGFRDGHDALGLPLSRLFLVRFTYTLVTGTGSTDNGSFTINGNQLKTAASFNYETKNSYSIRVCTTDGLLA